MFGGDVDDNGKHRFVTHVRVHNGSAAALRDVVAHVRVMDDPEIEVRLDIGSVPPQSLTGSSYEFSTSRPYDMVNEPPVQLAIELVDSHGRKWSRTGLDEPHRGNFVGWSSGNRR